jgi:hypothetical protein
MGNATRDNKVERLGMWGCLLGNGFQGPCWPHRQRSPLPRLPPAATNTRQATHTTPTPTTTTHRSACMGLTWAHPSMHRPANWYRLKEEEVQSCSPEPASCNAHTRMAASARPDSDCARVCPQEAERPFPEQEPRSIASALHRRSGAVWQCCGAVQGRQVQTESACDDGAGRVAYVWG